MSISDEELAARQAVNEAMAQGMSGAPKIGPDLASLDTLYKEMYPLPGQPEKEWVLKMREAKAEIERIGKRVAVAEHRDNCGDWCRNIGPATLVYDMTTHDCCGECNDAGEVHER